MKHCLVVLLLLILLIIFLFIRKQHDNSNIKNNKNKKIISCECPELQQTWHPGRVEHKLKCEKFKKLNPTLTKEELLKHEGF